ncbi:MAG: hypothetical protein ABSF85_04100 [Terriglobales bacterium]
MAKISTATFSGLSGTKYSFNVYPMDQSFKAIGAVYAVTRRYKNSKSGYSHDIIYVGETGDLSTRFDDHHKADCFVSHNANCICTHVDKDEDSRLNKEDDLIKQQNPDCND